MRRGKLGVYLIGMTGLTAIHAAMGAAPGPITNVTVFTDRALVTRYIDADVPKGMSSVQVDNLPGKIVTESVRVAAVGKDGAVAGVETRKRYSTELTAGEERRLDAELQTQRDQRQAIDDQVRAANIQLAFIEALGKEAPKGTNNEALHGELKPEKWKSAWETIGGGAAQALETIRKKNAEKRALDDKIRQLEKSLADIRSGRRDSVELTIDVDARSAQRIRLAVQYQVLDTGWSPQYDARLNSEQAALTLVQLGQVHQNTGEDWRNVELVLSTTRPSENAQIPRLNPWFIDFYRLQQRPSPRPAPAPSRSREMKLEAPAPSAAMAEADGAELQMEAPVRAVTATTEFAAEYRITGKVAVPSDNATHQFTIGHFDLKPRLVARTVPRIDPTAYLYADVLYNGDMPILPGQISMYRDGLYVGRADLALKRPGEAIELPFGGDDKVRVQHRIKNAERSATGIIEKNRRIERQYEVEITNHHAQPLEIIAIDQIPIAQDERIKIDWTKNSDAPTQRDLDGRRGVVAWSATQKAGEKRVLHYGYTVTYPESERIPGFE